MRSALLEPIWYQPKDTGAKAKGTNAELITDICEVWLKARDAGALSGARQRRVAERAEILIRGLARLGITALVDEATGYQAIRDKQALQQILDKYLRNELAAWAKRFPDEFYRQLFRLRGWKWRGMKVNKPQVVGHYTNDLVYERLAPGILEELQSRNPRNERGHRKGRHHQLLTSDIGHPALQQHLGALLGLMRISQSWRQFKHLVDTALPKKGDTLLLPFDLDEIQ